MVWRLENVTPLKAWQCHSTVRTHSGTRMNIHGEAPYSEISPSLDNKLYFQSSSYLCFAVVVAGGGGGRSGGGEIWFGFYGLVWLVWFGF